MVGNSLYCAVGAKVQKKLCCGVLYGAVLCHAMPWVFQLVLSSAASIVVAAIVAAGQSNMCKIQHSS